MCWGVCWFPGSSSRLNVSVSVCTVMNQLETKMHKSANKNPDVTKRKRNRAISKSRQTTKSYENLSRSMYNCVFLVLRALAKTEGAREVSETEMIIYCMRLAQQKMKFFNQTATNKIHAAPTRRYAMPNLMPHSLPRE